MSRHDDPTLSEDGASDKPGAVQPATASAFVQSGVGTQGELVLSYSASRSFEALVSYSLFLSGSFIRDTGLARTIHFVGREAAFRF